MTRPLQVFRLYFLCILFFASGTVSAQKIESIKIASDSLDRYGAIGLRPGIFNNLKKENQFTSATWGVFIDYNFGKYRHSIEIDFLAKRFRKIFRNTYAPCFTYHFSVKKQLPGKMELHPGVFFNCRKDMPNRKETYIFNDTAYLKSGQHTIFSIGPSIELSRRIFFSERNGFLTLGFRIAYSFDLMGFGYTFKGPFIPVTDRKWVVPADRFQKDVLTFTLKIGWGKFVRPEKIIPVDDAELRLD